MDALIAAIKVAYAKAEGVYAMISAPDDGALPLPAPIRGVARWTIVLYRELDRHQAFSKSSSLAYGSLVALVPMLVLTFAILQAVGLLALDNGAFERLLFDTFLGDIPQVRAILMPGLAHASFGVIGVVGMIGWLWISFRIYMTIEATFSDIFNVRVTRSIGRRLLNFYLALTAGPVMLALVLFGTVRVAEVSGIRHGSDFLGYSVPILLLTGLIKLMPSTPVRLGPAMAGGIVSGVLLQLGGVAFARYLDAFASKDPLRLLYGSIGIVPVFLFWLWLAWLFVLLGAEIAHVAQDYRSLMRAELEQRRAKVEKIKVPSVETALEVAATTAWYFRRGRTPIDGTALAERCRIPAVRIGVVLDVLERGGILVRVGDDGWTLAKSPDAVRVGEVVDVWRKNTSLRRASGDPLSASLEDALRPTLDGTLTEASERWVEAEREDQLRIGGADSGAPAHEPHHAPVARIASDSTEPK